MPQYPMCLYCQDRPAVKFFYYTKTYPNNKSTLESPIFCCDECSQKAIESLSFCRGGIENTKYYTFKQLGKMKEKEIGWLTSKRGWEINHLAIKPYRDLLFSIHYRNIPSKNETLIDALNWYRKQLESRIKLTENFDRRLSGLLDCTNEILKEVVNG